MRSIKLAIVLLIVAIFYYQSSIANTDKLNYPYIKPVIHIFTNFNSNINDNSQLSGFQITRSHLGLKAFLNENFVGVIYFGATNPNDSGKLDRSGYLKQAYLKYTSDKFSFRIGMIPLKIVDKLENFWGHRYVYKSFQEQYNFGSYYDIGAVAEYKIMKNLSVDLSFMNGEGIFANQKDKTYRGGIGLSYSFLNSFLFREYVDYSAKTDARSTISTFLGYHYKDKFSIGAEYDLQNNYAYSSNHNLNGISIYSTYYFRKNIDVFARYDGLASNNINNNSWNVEKDGRKIIAGIEFTPANMVRMSLNYQDWIPDNVSKNDIQKVYLDFEFKY